MHEAWPLIREIGNKMRADAIRSTVLAHAVLCVAALEIDVAAQGIETAASVAADACASDTAPRVELNDVLNKVAREISYDTPLNDAMQRVGYLAEKSTSLYLKVLANDAAIEEIIADRYCVGVRDEGFTEIGVYHVHLETWIVLARPIAKPALEDAALIEARVLELV